MTVWDWWKAISVALTGVFGVMGLLTTYKDKETGRMTVWGRINLAGIVVSALMGVLSQLVDASNRASSSAKSASAAQALASTAATAATQANLAADRAKIAATNSERTVAQLVAVSQETARIAKGTERSVANSRDAAEAGQVAASRTLIVARGTAEAVTASKAGLSRVERLLSPFTDPSVVLSSNDVDASLCAAKPAKIEVTLMISRPQPERPKTGSLSSLIAEAEHSDFTSTSYHGDGRLSGYTTSPGRCRFFLAADLQASNNDLEVLSYLDLPGKTVILYVKGFGANVKDLSYVSVRTRDGQRLGIPIAASRAIAGKDQGDAGEFGLSFTFPADRDVRSRTDSSSIF